MDFNGIDFPTLDSVIIDDANQGICHTFAIGPNVRNWKIGKLYCNNVPGSIMSLIGHRDFIGKGRNVVLDFPETYQPSQMQVWFEFPSKSISDEANQTKIILRCPYLILLTYTKNSDNSNIRYYVTEGLLSVYKTASNWKVISCKILPISSLG